MVAEGVSVLWATHLIEDLSPAHDDDVVVLHEGRVLAHGAVARAIPPRALEISARLSLR